MVKKVTDYPDVITIDDLCEILHIGKIKAYELLKEQIIKNRRIGKKFIIPRQSVQDFIDEI
jgi:hypothetical protein